MYVEQRVGFKVHAQDREGGMRSPEGRMKDVSVKAAKLPNGVGAASGVCSALLL